MVWLHMQHYSTCECGTVEIESDRTASRRDLHELSHVSNTRRRAPDGLFSRVVFNPVTCVMDTLAGGEGAGLYSVGLAGIGFVETKVDTRIIGQQKRRLVWQRLQLSRK